MPAPVVIEFVARGIPDVQRAFKNVEDIVVRAERGATRTTQREAKTRARSADQEAKDKVKAWLKADREVAKAHQVAARETERAAKAESRAAERAAREKVQAWQRADKEIARARQAGAREAEKVARDEARAFARAEQEKNRAAAQWMRRREREQRDERKERDRFAGGIVGAAGRGFSNGLQRAGAIALGAASAVTQLGGGFGLTDSVQRKVALRGKLADIANRGIMAGDANNSQRRSVDDLEGAVRATGAQFGIDPNEAADALDKFASKTGDLSTGLEMLKGLGELSRAGAGSLDDLADAAGDIFSADTKQSAADVLNTLRIVAVQGQKGAVEMKDLASQMAKLGAAAGRFEGSSGANIATMGALAQLARQGGGASSASQATTSVQALTNQFYKNARLEGFKSLGVNVKTKEGFNRNLDDVLVETMLGAEKKSRAATGGMQQFDQLFGGAVADAGARRSTLALEKIFKQAGGGQAGADAVRAKLAEFGSGGRNLKAEFADKASNRMQGEDVKLEQAMQKLRNTTADQLAPALEKAIPLVEQLVPPLARFLHGMTGAAEWASRHPFASLVGVLTASMTAEITKAAVGQAVARALTGQMAGVASVVGPAAAVAIAAAIALHAGKTKIDEAFDIEAQRTTDAVSHQAAATNMLAAMSRGTMTKDQRASAVGMLDILQSDMNAQQQNMANPGFVKSLAAGVGTFIDPSGTGEAIQVEQREQQRTYENTKEMYDRLAKAIEENTKATRDAANTPRSAPPPVSGANGAASHLSIVQRNGI